MAGFCNENIVCYSKTEEFRKACQEEHSQHMAGLLRDISGCDVKIYTKNKHELSAHKNILRARCPVFASMFRSELLKGSPGVINVNEIFAKTMKILLHYWYTGELLPSWEDNDTIVEFVYAAKKYQITQLVKILDNSVWSSFKASNADGESLNTLQNLSLRNGLTGVLKRTVHKITQAKNGVELLEWFSLAPDKFDEEICMVSHILHSFNEVLSEKNDIKACYRDITLLALACKHEVKHVETKLLHRIVDTVSKVTSDDELFALFDLHDYRADN